MDFAIVVNKKAHGTEEDLMFEVDTNNVQGFGVTLGLGSFALVCILAKCLFLYYLRVHAPKERPLNKLMALEQVRNHMNLFDLLFFVTLGLLLSGRHVTSKK